MKRFFEKRIDDLMNSLGSGKATNIELEVIANVIELTSSKLDHSYTNCSQRRLAKE